jgi:hypothetical protein
VPPEGTAVQVTLWPVTADVGETEQEAVSTGYTVTAVHAPQLLFSSDSVITPAHEALLSAQARTYHVPDVENVYEICETSVPEIAKVGDASVEVA